jgi:hypothetical protein
MANVTGELVLSAGGRDYRLHLGMSVLAGLQARHGQDVLAKLDAPPGVENWMPDLNIVVDLFLGALQRHHPEADRWLVDDLMAENPDALPRLMAAAFPDPGPAKVGNGKTPARRG